LLRQNPLFSRLTSEQLDNVCQYSKIIELKEGDVLFNYGETVHNFYFIYQGLIKLFRQSTDGQEKIFELESTGQTFAEALMFNDQTFYPVSAAAMKKSTVVAISTHKFLKLLKSSNDTCLLVMGNLSRRLHTLVNEIENLSVHTGRIRVAAFFIDQLHTNGMDFKLDVPKNAIASMLSLQPETFSRLLKELCDQDIIKVNESEIKILDLDLLRAKAGLIQLQH
jgi:CRP-like cAMP-binding protein